MIFELYGAKGGQNRTVYIESNKVLCPASYCFKLNIVTVSPLNPSGYMRRRGSTETLICMDPLNWHRLNFMYM